MRYSDPAPYTFALRRTLDTEMGFAVDGDLGRLEFHPPCLVTYTPDYAGMPFNGSLVIATYCVPTAPGIPLNTHRCFSLVEIALMSRTSRVQSEPKLETTL
jgi:hypothetical protein